MLTKKLLNIFSFIETLEKINIREKNIIIIGNNLIKLILYSL